MRYTIVNVPREINGDSLDYLLLIDTGEPNVTGPSVYARFGDSVKASATLDWLNGLNGA